MTKGKGTRSGLLWEVERLLKEMTELPQILLMENVPEVVGDKNISDFAEWISFLESIGYTNKYELLNAANYGVPQNRNRCFMVSWLGDYYYDFPEPIPLERRLKDVLEPVVDEKYYLSDETVQALIEHKRRNEEAGNGFGWQPVNGGGRSSHDCNGGAEIQQQLSHRQKRGMLTESTHNAGVVLYENT